MPALAMRAGVAACAVLAALNLLAGLSGGLARLGWAVPANGLAAHGAVLVCGFFGTLIALERAVALQRTAGLLAPLAAGAGGVLAWGFAQPEAAALCWGIAATVLVALYVLAGVTRAWSLHLSVELAAAVAWVLGTFAWARTDLPTATLGWMAFLVGTIAGERRELMQFVRLSTTARWIFVAVVVAGALAVLAANAALWWAVCATLALWLLRWDIAPRQWRRDGWVGHTGICLTLGYAWLLVAAALGLCGILGLLRPGGASVMAPHAVLLGFVFAMVFGHAPIILPALARVRPAYTRWARLPIWLLAASLLLRMIALEAASVPLLAWAGAGHALGIALFAAVMLGAVWRAPRRQSPA